ncbi:hypothetical protein BDV95DRAFT_632374 [Massariosphaeria phaeospora]|uniref:DUF7580 domain-containing protein n=1 Tax=Massariosphaeria phaeospora TaxID=100035 RepID=A0A7C8M005_9PLEO|nr:hypothetical protein BDV95DRAFT_632374 [Massariosphaeria phaeospora]
MSGLEVPSLVFGVLPLVIEAVKAYSTVSASFHTFRHYSKEVKTIHRQLKVHHGIFLNECRLLLRLVEDEKGVEEMLDDTNDQRWTSKKLNDKLNGFLKESFELCLSIIEASKETVDEMDEEMSKFDVLTAQKDKDESIKATIRRLRNAVRITFDKSKYEQSLANLRDRNFELSTLRAHIGAFQPKTCSDLSCVGGKALPSRIDAIKSTSQKLHEALAGAWCCGDLKHGGHYAKLCLDAEVQNEVRLDLAISCQETCQTPNERSIPEPPIWLYVQSVSIETTAYVDVTHTATPNSKRKAMIDEPAIATEAQKNNTSSGLAQLVACKKKKKPRKQVRFSTPDHEDTVAYIGKSIDEVSVAIATTVAQQTTSSIDLCKTKNICHYLKQNLQICGKSLNRHCVGYLESPMMYRHIFYLQEKEIPTNLKQKDPAQTLIFSICDVLGQGVDDTMTVVDQLKLAHKAALATLQFNGTPWLSQRWRLRDLSYFGTSIIFNEESLKTLHLSSQIASTTIPAMTAMEGVEGAVEEVSEEEYFGINNTTLFFLGVALLEIAHWKSLENLKLPKDPNEILTARRLASRPTPLGPKYQEIARKCLQCNFGFGTDLNKKELQAAVYGDVVCQLERMIESLSI